MNSQKFWDQLGRRIQNATSCFYQFCEQICDKSRQRCTLHDLPGVVVAEFPTRLLLEEVKLGSADGTIPIEVHPVKHLGQGLSVKTGGWVCVCVCVGGGGGGGGGGES